MQKKNDDQKPDYSSIFYSDLHDESSLYAVLVRSPISSGTIRSMMHPNLPDGYNLFTAEDIPGKNYISAFGTKFPVFARDHISYEGEPVGILIGKDFDILQKLLQEVAITFTQAFLPSEMQQKNEEKSICASRKFLYGDFATVWNNAPLQVEKTYSLKLNSLSNSEPNGAYCDAREKNVLVYTPTQWASNLRKNLTAVLACESENIHIHKTTIPLTETNSSWHNTTLAVQCALASTLTKRPILLRLTQSEQLLYNDCQQPITFRHRSAINENGLILGAEIYISIDSGAFNPLIQTIVDRMTVATINAYTPKNLCIVVSAFKTQTPPGSFVVQWADYHCFFAIENQIQEIARITKKNPAKVRLENISHLPSKLQDFPFNLNTDNYATILQTAIDKSDFHRKYTTYNFNTYSIDSIHSTVPLRGMGIATAYEGNGFLGSAINSIHKNLEVSMQMNGNVIIHAHAPSNIIALIWKKLAAEILSVNLDEVFIDSASLHDQESNLPETITDNISVMTQLVKKSCLALQKLRFRQPLPIKVNRTLSISRKNMWNPEDFRGRPYYNTSWIAAVAEIEMIPLTYTYQIRSIWIVIDGGMILHEKRGALVIQNCVKKILSSSLRYQNVTDPTLSITFLPSTTEPKKIGELVFNVLPAAICSAVSQALQQQITSFPIAPEVIHQFMKNIDTAYEKADESDAKNTNEQEDNDAHSDENQQ